MMSFRDAFQGKRADLTDKIDATHGLLIHLLDRDVITRQQCDDCRSAPTNHECTTKLLEILERKPESLFPFFCEALVASSQQHIVDYLTNSSSRSHQTSRPRNSRHTTTQQHRPQYNYPPASSPNVHQQQPYAASSYQHATTAAVATQQPYRQTSYDGGSRQPVQVHDTQTAATVYPAFTAQQQQQHSLLQAQLGNLTNDITVIPHSLLTNLELIHEGGFGLISSANHANWGKVVYKELKAMIIKPNDKNGRELLREAQAHGLRHVNIIGLIGVVFEPGHYGVVLEYAKYGGLDAFIGDYEVGWLMKMCLASGVITGLNYLHSRDPPVIHGDLKAQNVLVSDGYVTKICDFGLTKWRQFSTTRTASKSQRGTVTHIPPENWQNINYPRSVKFDMYGLGILLWELLSGKTPFQQDGMPLPSTEQIKAAVVAGQRPEMNEINGGELVDEVSLQFAKAMIEACSTQNPTSRPDIQDVADEFNQFLARNQSGVDDARKELDQQVSGSAVSRLSQ